MTALEAVFTALAVLAFGGAAWTCGIVGWRLLKSPQR